MYKASIRAFMRHSINKLNNGDFSLLLKMASPDFELAFPGENSWSTMFRPQLLGRERHVTHRGIDEATAFNFRLRTSSSTAGHGTPAWHFEGTCSSLTATTGPTCTRIGSSRSSGSGGVAWSAGKHTKTLSAWPTPPPPRRRPDRGRVAAQPARAAQF